MNSDRPVNDRSVNERPVIEILYPEVANLFGDLGNMEYLRQCMPDARFVSTALTERPVFADSEPSLIYMGPMSERSQELVLEHLRPYRERLARLIEQGVVFLITGNALELFGERILCEDGREIGCLGFFPTEARRRMMKRFNSPVLGELAVPEQADYLPDKPWAAGGRLQVTGFKSQFAHSYGDNSGGYLLDVRKGCGLEPGNPREGLRRGNFLATYLLGPILPLNPVFTAWLKDLMGCADHAAAYYEAAEAAFEKRLAEMERLRF